MSDTPADSIWIVTDDTPQIAIPDNNQGGNFRGINRSDETRETTGSKGVTDAVPVSAQKLEQEMTKFLGVVGRLFNQAEQHTQVKSGMQLEEIELSIEISGEGEVKLIGSGAKASGKGAIKLTFKRQAAT
ncbi:hypothetical protein H6G33_21640 [Calothrix sp. FACHB-1219]|uniref:Pepco domain-containing protein n=1 Tax=unclassified Calothrix TaxID=2619626 RepID=UPI0016841CE1|nr:MULTISPECIES: hypothetical protein [unclassified Calothrix]MBD2203806.1 hypothetical protein [Calothrix sp. FACHB-168]MBD2219624.1 hypothetical protein [Calothrix sp. FACHB-1219]